MVLLVVAKVMAMATEGPTLVLTTIHRVLEVTSTPINNNIHNPNPPHSDWVINLKKRRPHDLPFDRLTDLGSNLSYTGDRGFRGKKRIFIADGACGAARDAYQQMAS